MEIYNHNQKTGVCTYINLPDINNHDEINMIMVQYLLSPSLSFPVQVGQSKKHPKDQYVKKIGRELAKERVKTKNASITAVSKSRFLDLIIKLSIDGIGFITFEKVNQHTRYKVSFHESSY